MHRIQRLFPSPWQVIVSCMLWWVAAAAAVMLPAIVAAQEAAPVVAEAIAGQGWDTFATLYILGGGLVVGGLLWLAGWGIGKIKNTKAKEYAARFLAVFDVGLRGVHARLKVLLDEARAPDSPGGVAITQGEITKIRAEMWEYLKKTYGSFDAIAKVVGVFTGAKTAEGVNAFVNAKIDGGVAELEREEKAAGAPGPA